MNGAPADTVDLGRERRIRRLVAEIRERTRNSPRLRARVNGMLAGALRLGPPRKARMTSDPIRSIRIPDRLWKQIGRLADALKDDPELTLYGKVTPSTVVRMALARGITALAEQYGVDLDATRRPRRPAKPKGPKR